MQSSLESVSPKNKNRLFPMIPAFPTEFESPRTAVASISLREILLVTTFNIPTHVCVAAIALLCRWRIQAHHKKKLNASFLLYLRSLGDGRDHCIDGLSHGRVVRLVALRGDGGELALIRE